MSEKNVEIYYSLLPEDLKMVVASYIIKKPKRIIPEFYELFKNIENIDFIYYVSKSRYIEDFIYSQLIDEKSIIEHIDWICDNPFAINIISRNVDKITTQGWTWLCSNKNAIEIISRNLDKLTLECWERLCLNENAIELIHKNINKLSCWGWKWLCMNNKAIPIFLKNRELLEEPDILEYLCCNQNKEILDLIIKKLDKIKNWYHICSNPLLIQIIEKNLDKLDQYCWDNLCTNPSAIELISKNLDKLSLWGWRWLCGNVAAVELISKNLDKIDPIGWEWLSSNENAIKILEKNPDKINWNYLTNNKNIDTINLLKKYRDKIKVDRYSLLSMDISIFLEDDKEKYDLMLKTFKK